MLESSRPALAEKGLQLEITAVDADALVHGDELRLQQVVWNLLINAIKFTCRGGIVSLSRSPRVDDSVELTVADDGEGLSAGLLAEVFERFKQGDSPAGSLQEQSRGLGFLGLWIARDIVELHGGSIRAASPGLDRGATFVVRLPVTGKLVSDPNSGDDAIMSAARRAGRAVSLSRALLRGPLASRHCRTARGARSVVRRANRPDRRRVTAHEVDSRVPGGQPTHNARLGGAATRREDRRVPSVRGDHGGSPDRDRRLDRARVGQHATEGAARVVGRPQLHA